VIDRSFVNVIFGGFGGFGFEAGTVTACMREQDPVKSCRADEAAFIVGNAETMTIVLAYRLAEARSTR
jgi:NAD(P) transhydrogenase subunit beta